MVIPWTENRRFFESLMDPVRVRRVIHGRDWTFLVEPPRWDCLYLCTVDDVARVLALLPEEHLEGLSTIVLRQSTRKQERQQSVWGRWCLAEQLGAQGRRKSRGWGEDPHPDRITPVLYLEAHRGTSCGGWNHPDPEARREMERLQRDGHLSTSTRRGQDLFGDVRACRATQLYRTVPHEVGHHEDYWQRVMRPARGKSVEAWRTLNDRFWSRPGKELEDFAHGYADAFRTRMFEQGLFPFDPLIEPDQLTRDALDGDWFITDLDPPSLGFEAGADDAPGSES
jgi:hypothetical protein